jgi:hypothetical protein
MHAVAHPDRLVLDGEWDFQLLPDPLAERHDSWRSIQVPGLWTIQDTADRPHYTNIAMPFDAPYPHPPRANPTGVYRRRFAAGRWSGCRVVLHVGAAESVLLARLNGTEVGISKDSHLAAEFDITDLVRPGDNELELTVVKWSDATFIEDQDQWWHGGISRSVYIYTTGMTYLADLHAVADFDPERRRGALTLRVDVTNRAGELEEGWTVRAHVAGQPEPASAPVPRAKSVASALPPRPGPGDYPDEPPKAVVPDGVIELLSLMSAGAPLSEDEKAIAPLIRDGAFPPRGGHIRLDLGDLAVQPWSAEDPRLYPLVVELIDPAGTVAERATLRVGFRRVEIRGRDLLVNGRRVWIQGVNMAFRDLSHLVIDLQVETVAGPGLVVTVPAPAIPPGDDGVLDLPDPVAAALAEPTAIALTLTARLATATAWAAEGVEIARLQVPLGISVALPAAGVASGRLPLDEGLLAHPWLSSPPMLSLWRALTDNDLAIPLNGRPVRSGLFRVTRTLLDRGISGSTATAVSRYTTAYGATIDHWQHVAALSDSSFRFHEHVLLDDELDDIPRLGITFATIAGFEHVSWLGLGPHETYPDRLRSGLLGRWESAVEDLMVPYLRPQENGGRARVHELTLSDEDGRRITVRTDRPMQMNVSHLRPADLESSRHDWELKARPETFVHLDVAHRGLGTAAVGPDTHPDCRVRGGEYRWSWQLDVS